ncbi:hypothetical protein PBOI14_30760 [Pseudomonas sp. Boi14]|nr:hypothetical protein PBOI14_30760 [Pseudomonas sp. Boi14]
MVTLAPDVLSFPGSLVYMFNAQARLFSASAVMVGRPLGAHGLE